MACLFLLLSEMTVKHQMARAIANFDKRQLAGRENNCRRRRRKESQINLENRNESPPCSRPSRRVVTSTPAKFFSLAEASENSPQFQLRVCVPKTNQAPTGRKKFGWKLSRVIFCRPSGTRFILSAEPTVETVGYFLTRLRRCKHPAHARFHQSQAGTLE